MGPEFALRGLPHRHSGAGLCAAGQPQDSYFGHVGSASDQLLSLHLLLCALWQENHQKVLLVPCLRMIQLLKSKILINQMFSSFRPFKVLPSLPPQPHPSLPPQPHPSLPSQDHPSIPPLAYPTTSRAIFERQLSLLHFNLHQPPRLD